MDGIYGYNNMNFYPGNNYGGYPNGYPPNMPQPGMYSPFPDPTQINGGFGSQPQNPYMNYLQNQQQTMSAYTPGMVHPVQLEDNNGNVVNAPSMYYNQGGATINQGGFNPITGGTNRAVGSTGYNLLHDNPISPNVYNPYYNGNNMVQQNYNYSPNYTMGMNIRAQIESPYMRPYGYSNGYPQNEFDIMLADIMYNDKPEALIDINGRLANVVLTKEEKDRLDRNSRGQYIGTNYYGQPMYSNGYNDNARRQEEFEEARHHYQSILTRLSRVAHAYTNEEIDEDKMMARWDPVPKSNYSEQKMFNYYTATPEEREEYAENVRVGQALEIVKIAETISVYNENLKIRKFEGYAKIKASHDEMLGIKSGENYDLSTYMDNGYKLLVHAKTQEIKKANRDASYKYSRNAFRTGLATATNTDIPPLIQSKDDQYVSTEEHLKRMYLKNKVEAESLHFDGNNVTYTTGGVRPQVFSTNTEQVFRDKFNEEIRNKQAIVDARTKSEYG